MTVIGKAGESLIVQVDVPQRRWYSIILRPALVIGGSIVALVGVIFAFTLIGILAAIPLWIAGGGIVSAGLFRMTKITCPYCAHRVDTRVGALNVKCRRCRNTSVIEWRA